jgi:hypothetical protein
MSQNNPIGGRWAARRQGLGLAPALLVGLFSTIKEVSFNPGWIKKQGGES